MKTRPIFAAAVFFLAVAVSMLMTPYAEAFWYGEEPITLPPDATCDTLDDIASQKQREMRRFNNRIGELPGIKINKPDKTWDGYTLLSCIGGCSHPSRPGEDFNVLLIDNEGRFVNGWTDIVPIPAKMQPGGYVRGGAGGGFGGDALILKDWDGDEVWRWDVFSASITGDRWHHDHNRQGSPTGYYAPGMDPKLDGKTLILCTHTPEEAYMYPKAWVPQGHPSRNTSHISMYPLVDDAIYIVDKEGRIKWQWFAADHFEQMGFSDIAKEGIMNVPVRPIGGTTDWTHFNNVNWLGENKWFSQGDQRFHPDNIIFDSRTSAMIGIIAHDDNPGHWNKGDIIWRTGPTYGEGTPWAALGQIIGPHTGHMIPGTLPGGGNILVFDNGGQSSYGARDYGGITGCSGTNPNAYRDHSRVLEFDPTTFEVVWEYKNTNEFIDDDGNRNRKFFSTFISSAQRLPNGNTLIAEGNMGRVFEVTTDGEIVWEYLAGTEGGGPGVIGLAVYRAYRYPKSWVPEGVIPLYLSPTAQ